MISEDDAKHLACAIEAAQHGDTSLLAGALDLVGLLMEGIRQLRWECDSLV